MAALNALARAGAALAGFVCLVTAAHADNATLLGVSKNWKAFSNGTGADKVCYAITQPVSSQPRKLKREAVGFLINDWPSKGARAQPEIVSGYKFKDNSEVTVQVGGDKFTFYTTNDGGSGSAWMNKVNEEARVVAAMQRGAQAVVTGISAHGTMTHDTYSLNGLADVLTKIHTACSM
jgi:hypothetical protein